MHKDNNQNHSGASDRTLIISLAVLLVILGGVITYFVLTSQDRADKQQQAKVDHSTTMNHMNHSKMTTQELIDATKLYIEKEITTTVTLETGNSPSYKPAGSPTYILLANAPTLIVPLTNQATVAKTAVHISDYLRDTHQIKITTAYGANESSPAVIENDTLICQVGASVKDTDVAVSCEAKATYEKELSTYLPFGIALLAADTDTSNIVLSNPRIQASKTSGYQTATSNVSPYLGSGGSAALFYKKTSGDWHYLTSTQSELPCTTFSTTDSKNAFAGTPCYVDGSSVDSVVNPAIKN